MRRLGEPVLTPVRGADVERGEVDGEMENMLRETVLPRTGSTDASVTETVEFFSSRCERLKAEGIG